MVYVPSAEQEEVIESDAPVLVVIGGAGTGKTTTAAAAAGRRLHNLETQRNLLRSYAAAGTAPVLPPLKRVLFVSFSRTAVSQIVDRSAGVLGPHHGLVDVVTFHGLAWRILNDFGRYYGHPHPFRVQSAAETDLSVTFPGATYKELVPAATALLQIPTVSDYYERRYGTVICDEFQDTSDDEWAFIQSIAPSAQRLLLGDPNQCIYASMKNIDPFSRVAQATGLPGAIQIELPAQSHRDPSGILPAVALAAMKRDFNDPAIVHAIDTRRIVLHYVPAAGLAAGVAAIVNAERAAQKTVSIFTHTQVATAELSSHLTAAGIQHEQVGFTEALGDGLQAQFALLRWALTGDPGARVSLAVYVRSTSRSGSERRIPEAIVAKSMPAFEAKFTAWANEFHAAAKASPDWDYLLGRLAALHEILGLPRGADVWRSANRQLRRAVRVLERGGTVADLGLEIDELRVMTLVGARAPRAKPVQVMNLHQTKGREADITVLMLQPDEFHGYETEPFPAGSRLLYVCLTRARERAHIVLPEGARTIHGLWAPFITACVSAELL
ncbi:MAG: UvrD-helicase domain-containing protein [Propionibacteriaceae bacterium]